jgi:hypothetical protein
MKNLKQERKQIANAIKNIFEISNIQSISYSKVIGRKGEEIKQLVIIKSLNYPAEQFEFKPSGKVKEMELPAGGFRATKKNINPIN